MSGGTGTLGVKLVDSSASWSSSSSMLSHLEAARAFNGEVMGRLDVVNLVAGSVDVLCKKECAAAGSSTSSRATGRR